MSDKTRYVVERFPELAQAIKQYASDNRFFHSLCEDYGQAVEMMRRWEQSSDSEASPHFAMCHELVADLEQEILAELQLWNEGGGRIPGAHY
jgi:hypothetical protein